MKNIEIPRFKEEKAIAVAAMLLRLSGGSCDKYWLNKLMYYVERQSLVKSGQPIFFDRLYSVRYGPIVSAVMDGIESSEYPVDNLWARHFSVEGKTVSLREDADDSVLSPFEEKLIEEAYNKFKGWTFPKLLSFFHSLPENKNTTSREVINYDEILQAEGFDPETIEKTFEEISYLNYLESIVNCAPC
jgi:hypothetical protein